MLQRRSFLLGWFPFLHRRLRAICGVEFRILRHGHSPRRYLFIHGNEDTAREAIALHLREHNGYGLAVTGKERNVAMLGLQIDPNRMFSRAGAEKSLRTLNASAIEAHVTEVLDYLDRERDNLLRELVPKAGSRLVALHNNRNYSVQDEIASSDETSIRQPELPRNFFLCTDPRDFAALKQSPYNVVLQTKPEPDDGSLSRLAAKRGFRYINLECAIGELDAQRERMNWLEANVP